MAATRKIIKIVGVFLLAGCTGLRGEKTEFSRQQAAFDATSECLAAIDGELKPALEIPPKFTSIKEAVGWTRLHLTREFGSIFERAGISLKKKTKGVALADLARNRDDFQQLIYPLVAFELESYERCQANGAELVVPDKVANLLALTLRLSEEPMYSKFYALGLNDSYYIEQAFLMMLVLDTTGEPWDERWLVRDTNKGM
jgi:hypothetical protein